MDVTVSSLNSDWIENSENSLNFNIVNSDSFFTDKNDNNNSRKSKNSYSYAMNEDNSMVSTDSCGRYSSMLDGSEIASQLPLEEHLISFFGKINLASIRNSTSKSSIHPSDRDLRNIWANQENIWLESSDSIAITMQSRHKLMSHVIQNTNENWDQHQQRWIALEKALSFSKTAESAILQSQPLPISTLIPRRIPSFTTTHTMKYVGPMKDPSHLKMIEAANESILHKKRWSLLADVYLARDIARSCTNTTKILLNKEILKLVDSEIIELKKTFSYLIDSQYEYFDVRGKQCPRHDAAQRHKKYLFRSLKKIILDPRELMNVCTLASVQMSYIQSKWLKETQNWSLCMSYAVESLNNATAIDKEDGWVESKMLLCVAEEMLQIEISLREQAFDSQLVESQNDIKLYLLFADARHCLLIGRKTLAVACNMPKYETWETFVAQYFQAATSWKKVEAFLDKSYIERVENSSYIAIRTEIESAMLQILEWKVVVYMRISEVEIFKISTILADCIDLPNVDPTIDVAINVIQTTLSTISKIQQKRDIVKFEDESYTSLFIFGNAAAFDNTINKLLTELCRLIKLKLDKNNPKYLDSAFMQYFDLKTKISAGKNALSAWNNNVTSTKHLMSFASTLLCRYPHNIEAKSLVALLEDNIQFYESDVLKLKQVIESDIKTSIYDQWCEFSLSVEAFCNNAAKFIKESNSNVSTSSCVIKVLKTLIKTRKLFQELDPDKKILKVISLWSKNSFEELLFKPPGGSELKIILDFLDLVIIQFNKEIESFLMSTKDCSNVMLSRLYEELEEVCECVELIEYVENSGDYNSFRDKVKKKCLLLEDISTPCRKTQQIYTINNQMPPNFVTGTAAAAATIVTIACAAMLMTVLSKANIK